MLLGVGSWSANEFDAYTALSPSVRFAVASGLILAAGVISAVLAVFFLAGCCWETPNENRCEYICVRN